MKHNIIVTTNENDIWKLIEHARLGTTVRLLGIGSSMCPLLESGRDYIDLIAVNHDTKLYKNDIVFYKANDNQYVTHRIYSISEKGYHMLGDGNLCIEPLINKAHIYLKAVGFVRKGKYIPVEAKRYLIYVFLWTKLYPIRIHLLRLYHRYGKLTSVLKKEKNMKIKEDFMLRNICEDWIVIPMGERLLEFNGMMKLNQSGSFIWKLLEMEKSREDIISAMLEEYDIQEETATHEFDIFLQSLTDANILEA
jgi:hypothetical protein